MAQGFPSQKKPGKYVKTINTIFPEKKENIEVSFSMPLDFWKKKKREREREENMYS